ncbi:hypothetical protein F8154_01115 [Alkaliphilus pronyensis]|uniref:Uncharacterized protein n=1 Tax=Alkaliphilus pronyensis TaxID=1482732 RepID=A0A6I0F7Z1_9FIRM|nr:hypothetical protein [Alkaliphilus pronyensis]KAB3539061.1 hypothetical protein F8154_01115 [Alkaliphilus pronyensis]
MNSEKIINVVGTGLLTTSLEKLSITPSPLHKIYTLKKLAASANCFIVLLRSCNEAATSSTEAVCSSVDALICCADAADCADCSASFLISSATTPIINIYYSLINIIKMSEFVIKTYILLIFYKNSNQKKY